MKIYEKNSRTDSNQIKALWTLDNFSNTTTKKLKGMRSQSFAKKTI